MKQPRQVKPIQIFQFNTIAAKEMLQFMRETCVNGQPIIKLYQARNRAFLKGQAEPILSRQEMREIREKVSERFNSAVLKAAEILLKEQENKVGEDDVNMPQVEVKGLVTPDGSVQLHNGDLVIAKGQAHLVSSYRDADVEPGKKAPYCSLIRLDTGSPAFYEKCSRNTSFQRIANHLRSWDSDIKPCDLVIVPKDKYSVTIGIKGN